MSAVLSSTKLFHSFIHSCCSLCTVVFFFTKQLFVCVSSLKAISTQHNMVLSNAKLLL